MDAIDLTNPDRIVAVWAFRQTLRLASEVQREKYDGTLARSWWHAPNAPTARGIVTLQREAAALCFFGQKTFQYLSLRCGTVVVLQA